ncbi:unnamed protein product [Ophioblennius macclurei]
MSRRTRLTAIPGHSQTPPYPSQPERPRPPAFPSRIRRYRSSRTSLGYISTPLRKRPNNGRRPSFATAAPYRANAHVTKPAVAPLWVKPTAKPTSAGIPKSMKNVTNVSGSAVVGFNLSVPTSRPSFVRQTFLTEASTPHPEPGVSLSTQRKGEISDRKENPAAMGAAPSSPSSSSSSAAALSNRKNKPAAGLPARESQVGQWTSPPDSSSGSGTFVFDPVELLEESSDFGSYDFAILLEDPGGGGGGCGGRDPESQRFSPRSDSGVAAEVMDERLPEQTYFQHDSDGLQSDFAADGRLSLDLWREDLVPEASITLAPPSALTAGRTFRGVPGEPASDGQKAEESLRTRLERLTLQPSLWPAPPLASPSSTVVASSTSGRLAGEIPPERISSLGKDQPPMTVSPPENTDETGIPGTGAERRNGNNSSAAFEIPRSATSTAAAAAVPPLLPPSLYFPATSSPASPNTLATAIMAPPPSSVAPLLQPSVVEPASFSNLGQGLSEPDAGVGSADDPGVATPSFLSPSLKTLKQILQTDALPAGETPSEDKIRSSGDPPPEDTPSPDISALSQIFAPTSVVVTPEREPTEAIPSVVSSPDTNAGPRESRPLRQQSAAPDSAGILADVAGKQDPDLSSSSKAFPSTLSPVSFHLHIPSEAFDKTPSPSLSSPLHADVDAAFLSDRTSSSGPPGGDVPLLTSPSTPPAARPHAATPRLPAAFEEPFIRPTSPTMLLGGGLILAEGPARLIAPTHRFVDLDSIQNDGLIPVLAIPPLPVASLPRSPLSPPSSPAAVLASQIPLLPISASVTDAEIGSSSPTRHHHHHHHHLPPTIPSPPAKYLHSSLKSSPIPESAAHFITNASSFSAGDKLNSSRSQSDGGDGGGGTADASRSDDFTASSAGKLTKSSAVFDPADVVPKIHIEDEQASAFSGERSEESVSSDETSEVVTAGEELNLEVFPTGIATNGSVASTQPTPMMSNPQLSRPGGEIHVEAATRSFKHKFNASTASTVAPIGMTNATKASIPVDIGRIGASDTSSKPTPQIEAYPTKNASSSREMTNATKPTPHSPDLTSNETHQVQHALPSPPVAVGVHRLTTVATLRDLVASASALGLKKATPTRPALRPPTGALATGAATACRCKHGFHFTCLCGLSSGNKGLFYRISLLVDDGSSALTPDDVEQTVALWLNQTFHNWTHAVYVDNISVQPAVQSGENPTSYSCRALLVHYDITNESVGEAAVSARLSSSLGLMGGDLEVQPASVSVHLIENCPEENPLHYRWPESRPTITQYLPCFPNKDQSTSRTCLINLQNYSSYWSAADFSNCTDIDTIEVSAENAAEVAVQLADITNDELSVEEVSKVVTKVNQLVNVAKINKTLAKTVVTIISNVMTSAETTLAHTSERALKTVEELVQKIEFEEPSINITSRNLAVGILAVDAEDFNGTSFSAFVPPNSTDPQVDFESQQLSSLAQVVLPASLLTSDSLSDADRATLSRINFMFFSSTSLFQQEQEGRSLNSYVVASSVGNLSVSNLVEPVVIEITHLSEQTSPSPVCVFWDFSMNEGAGGWNAAGCRASEESTSNKTICLCDHLTHFGILMDISGASPHIDPKNNKILTFITYIGCGVSAIFSAATLLTYIAFEKLRRDYPSKILMNLSTSLLLLNMVFLLDGWLASLDAEWLCLAVAVLLHYFLLTSFTWMGLESVHMYIALVKVFNTYIRRYILKFCVVGWGLPAVLVGIVVSVDKHSYGLQEYGKGQSAGRSSEFCWIQKPAVFYVTCVGYFCLVFLLNVAMFVVVMMQICGRNGKRSNRTLREEVLRNLRSVVSLTFLLGMTWGFALFAWGPVSLPFMYLFAIFNSLQGLFIFVFHCALKENVQKQWRRYLCCGKFRLSDNSDWSKTATNNTKKVSSDNLGKSLSSSSFGSSTANWTSKAKATLNPFAKRHSNTDKGYSGQAGPKCISSSSSSSEAEPTSSLSSSSSSSILPVSQMIDKVKGYCSTRSDNFYKNIIMSDSFAHSTRF